jgi:hypothetical protein
MRKICLTLPTDRECGATIRALAQEAAYAAGHFGVQVHLLILDSAGGAVRAGHAEAVRAVRGRPDVLVRHLDEAAQRAFLTELIDRAGLPQPGRMLDLMLPAESSYGACTNRAFLLARALGCDFVHRRDSDSRYQWRHGAPVFPIHQELTCLGARAAEAARQASETMLDPAHADQPVVLVGSSFVGDLSVDIGEIYALDPEVYYDVVSLWAPGDWPEPDKRRLAAGSFRGAEPFAGDHSTLTIVDPMRVDMHNISFYQVHEDIPLLPATNTIGSDYFLIHVVHDARLPGVQHNRNIVNFHTAERKTPAGFAAYQLRLVKFFLSMLYLHFIYRRMAAAGPAMLDRRHRVRPSVIAEFVRESTGLDTAENAERLRILDRAYGKLGGKYAAFAGLLRPLGPQLLAEARQDMEDFAVLIESWPPLIQASRAMRAGQVPG